MILSRSRIGISAVAMVGDETVRNCMCSHDDGPGLGAPGGGYVLNIPVARGRAGARPASRSVTAVRLCRACSVELALTILEHEVEA